MQTFKFYLLVILFFNNFKCRLLSSLPFSLPSYKHILFSLQILFPSHIHVIVCVRDPQGLIRTTSVTIDLLLATEG